MELIKIVVIGAGQLGSRHLQGLAKLSGFKIQVVDSSEMSLTTAKQRFEEVSIAFKGEILFHKNITEIEKNIDVAIVATNSSVRRSVVEQLLSHSTVKNLILEKFLFTKLSEYNEVAELIERKNVKTWVNCPRRMVSFYNTLKQNLTHPFTFSVSGNAWGLGCNGIHFLDLFSFLSNSKNILINSTLLDNTIHESKRAGYIEFTGTIVGSFDKNSFSLTSFNAKPSGVIIEINSQIARYIIEEGATSKVRYALQENDWQWKEETFEIPFQSQLTNVVVEDILQTGDCKLTQYADSSAIHQVYLSNFISFLQTSKQDNSINECLIT
ncbi:MAG: Gfo/Idh/MocA family oxidoreductase [Bacteroidota bacterium]